MVYKRRGDRVYAYRSVIEGGRPRSIYVGPEAVGRLIEAIEAEEKRLRAEREAERRRRDEAEAETIAVWCREVDQLLRQALGDAGYHQHERGEWRRRNMASTTLQPTSAPTSIAPAPSAKPSAAERHRDIMQRWRGGETPITEAEAGALLREYPALVDGAGSPAMLLRVLLLKRNGVDKDELLRLATTRKVEQIERDLAGPDPTPMERLLAERAAICWLDMYSCQQSAEAMQGGISLAQATYQQRRIDAAHRRFLSAVRSLAVVRKLKLPNLKVEIDGRSVSITNHAPAAPAKAIDPA